MKKYTLLLILSLSILRLSAQTEVSIKVLDAHTGLPLDGAHLTMYSTSDSSLTKTNSSGEVIIEHPESIVGIKVSHVAYLPFRGNFDGKSKWIFLRPSNQQLEEVIVTGQASPVLASQAVRQVKVINRKRMDEQAAVNLSDLLNKEMNFALSEDGVLGSRMSLQGLSGAKVKILIDGVPVIGRLDGNIDISQINLNNIERIEIVEGPMSVQYGTDAMAGTINLISKKEYTSSVKGELNGYYETAGRYNADASITFPIFRKTQTTVSLGRNYFRGYDADPDSRDLQWNPKEQYFSSVSLHRRYKKLLVRYKLDYFHETILNRGAIGSMDSLVSPADTGAWKYPRALDDSYITRRLNNSLTADYYINENIRLKALLAYNYFNRQKSTSIKNLSTGDQELFGGLDAQDTSLFTMWSSRMFFEQSLINDKLSYQAGYDFSHEMNKGERIEGDVQAISDAALFLSLEYNPFKNIKLHPGLRYAYNSRFEAPLISSMALRWQASPKWILRASYGQGYRAPTLKEMYFLFVDENHNILGNRGLKAETSDNYQLNLTYSSSGKHNNWNVNLKGFFNNIQDEIRLVSVIDPSDEDARGLYRNENIARSQTLGGNLSTEGQFNNCSMNAGISLIGIKNNLAFELPESSEKGTNFSFYPQMQFNLSREIKKWKLNPSVYLKHTGSRSDFSLSGNTLQKTEIQSFTLLDFNLQKWLFNQRFCLSAGIKNIFDVTDLQSQSTSASSVHSSGNGAILISYGRSYFVKAQFNF